MKCFYEYIEYNNFSKTINRIANLMEKKGVDPYNFIAQYLNKLDNEAPINEFLGGFFKRLGAAWTAFWKTPSVDDPSNRLETAKQALNDLITMLKKYSGAEQKTIETVIRGLEQSLNLVSHVEPTIKQYNSKMMNYGKGDASAALPDIAQQLPEDLNKKFIELMNAHDQIMNMPNSEDKYNKLRISQKEIDSFYSNLIEIYHNTKSDNSKKEYNARIGNFLMRVRNDAAFNKIMNIMNFASQSDVYYQVLFVWKNIIIKTNNYDEQKKQLLEWYKSLNQNHPVKIFINEKMKDNEFYSEEDLFLEYANYWINNFG